MAYSEYLANSDFYCYHKVNDGSGATVTDFLSTYDLSLTGSYTWIGGKIGSGAIKFTANGAEMYRNSNMGYTQDNPFTVSFWWRLDADGSYGVLGATLFEFLLITGVAYYVYYKWHNDSTNNYRLRFYRSNIGHAEAGPYYYWTATVGTWYMLSFTFDASKNATIYINGNQVASVNTGSLVGDTGYANRYEFNYNQYNPWSASSSHDDCVFSKTAWSAEKVRRLYKFQRGLYVPRSSL